MSVLLAIESSGAGCSAALWRDGAVVAVRDERMAQGHAARLPPMVFRVLAEGGLAPPLGRRLDAVAVTVGPGSFTGIRVGLAAARGLALATGAALYGITSLELMAAEVGEQRRAGRALLVLLDSKRRDLFAQLFGGPPGALSVPTTVPAEALAALLPPGPLLVAGDGAEADVVLPTGVERLTGLHHHAGTLARLAAARIAAGATMLPAAPLYLRPPDVSLPKRRP